MPINLALLVCKLVDDRDCPVRGHCPPKSKFFMHHNTERGCQVIPTEDVVPEQAAVMPFTESNANQSIRPSTETLENVISRASDEVPGIKVGT